VCKVVFANPGALGTHRMHKHPDSKLDETPRKGIIQRVSRSFNYQLLIVDAVVEAYKDQVEFPQQKVAKEWGVTEGQVSK
jgi:hypothetical protein